MLVELSVGDAYGAGFEYVKPKHIDEFNNLKQYTAHPKHKIKPGCYTDDAQMSIAIAEAMLEYDRFTPLDLADKFVAVFKRDPREGYASGFYGLLTEVENGQELLDRLKGNNKSDKSGAAMRAVPLGMYPQRSKVVHHCAIQARITHDTDDGIWAAQAAALMSHYFYHQLGSKKHIGEFLSTYVPGDWNVPYIGEVGPKGWMSVRAAITAVVKCNRLSELLRVCVDFGGDVDTVATIALGCAAHANDYIKDLPSHLVENLENGKYGHDYLVQLDQKLMAKKWA
jgi:ADP-ribosylglycohydrolase